MSSSSSSSSSFLKPCPISRQNSPGNMFHVLESKHMAKINGNYNRSSNMINFGKQNGDRNYYYDNYSGGIEFKPHTADEAEESGGVISPPLWKTSPSTSPPTETEREETIPLHSHPYNHHHYRLLSPTSRSQAIARGRQELMEMVKNMPESSYELSLKDLVDHQSKLQGRQEQEVDHVDTESADDYSFSIQTEKKKNVLTSGSMNNGPILLKMIFPTSLSRNKKNKMSKSKSKISTTATCSKVSPRPVSEGDKEVWKKRFSAASRGIENNGSNSVSGSSGSRNSSSSSSSSGRNKRDFLPGCWSFFCTNKNKTKGQNGSRF